MELKIEQMEKKLNQNNTEGIFLFYGEETFLLESCVKKIKKNFGEIVNGINYITIYESNIKELISDIQTPAFGYEKKLIIVKNSKILEKQGKKKDKEREKLVNQISEYIENNIEEINKSVILVFIEESTEKNALYKTIEKYGVVCNFEELKQNQLIARIKAISKAYKVNISDVNANYLIEQCGTNMQTIINELRKLIEYRGENSTIEKKDIDLLCIKQIQAVIFDLTDNLGKKEIKNALDVLNNLLYNKEPIQKVLITLYNHFKKIYITKIALEKKLNIAESLALKPNQMFLTNKYKAQANYFSEQELRNILQELINLDFKYKQGLIDVEIGLNSILCKYCSK